MGFFDIAGHSAVKVAVFTPIGLLFSVAGGFIVEVGGWASLSVLRLRNEFIGKVGKELYFVKTASVGKEQVMHLSASSISDAV